jgi:excisionase family DNA binding protein
VVEIPLAKVGLMTVVEAAGRLGRSARGVQKLILDGHLPAVVAGAGRRAVYLVRESDVKAFTPPPMGRPPKGGRK